VSTLKVKLAGDRFVITAEIAPPVSCDASDLMAKAAPLKGLADAVNVTDGAGARAHMGSVAAAAILREAGIEPMRQRRSASATCYCSRATIRSRATSRTPSRCSITTPRH